MSTRLSLYAVRSLAMLLVVHLCCLLGQPAIAEQPVSRVPWTSSKLMGSPDPPLPYVLERAYPLEFTGPISINRMPASDRMLVAEQQGKIFSFDASLPEPPVEIFADFNATPPPLSDVTPSDGRRRIQLFSLAFHPRYDENHFAYVCYITVGDSQPTITHIARFQVSSDERPQLLMESEYEILKCEGGGHNGCTLVFGPDGYLYISLGDLASPNPPDPRNTGQDISDLYSSILRIDVDHQSPGLHYAIPADNPFVDLPDARGEVYSYGYRNPFRMSFDPLTGDLWVGDVGWEAWEMVYRVKPGGNYGWSITEGPGEVKLDQPTGPTPILPADIALGHAEAASVTGGMVYRGAKYPDLHGTYIFGDWTTRTFWAASFDSERVTGYREIAFGSVKPVCFESTADGELLILDYADANQPCGIHRFIPNPALQETHPPFPRRLSQTGLFTNTADYVLAPGVLSYHINAPMWKDGAVADFLVAIPGQQAVTFYAEPQATFDWFKTRVKLPRHSVLAKTYSWQSSADHPPQRLETQIALKDEQDEWQFYTYCWNKEGTDAELVDAAGTSMQVEIDDGELLSWNFASRTSCRMCHTPWRGESLGLVEEQLRRPLEKWDSWRELLASGVAVSDADHSYATGARSSNSVQFSSKSAGDVRVTAMVDPHDVQQPIDLRARSYLHANCAHCHLFGGNASTIFDLSFERTLRESKMIGEPPMRGDLGLTGSSIIRPGRPTESILCYRVSKSGAGRMPHLGTQRTDPLAVRLVRQWIALLPEDAEQLFALDLVCGAYPHVDRQQRLEAAQQLLGSTDGAMEIAAAISEGRVAGELVRAIVDLANSGPPGVRDLLEPFAAADQRLPRLGENFDPAQILDRAGDPTSGRALFAAGVGTCSNCHRAGAVGKQVGPELTHVATKLKTKQAILHSILKPSADIHPDFITKLVLTVDGDVLTGNVVEHTAQQLMLRDANGKVTVLPAELVETVKPSTVSLMPEHLLAPLSCQQAADLLAFLTTLE